MVRAARGSVVSTNRSNYPIGQDLAAAGRGEVQAASAITCGARLGRGEDIYLETLRFVCRRFARSCLSSFWPLSAGNDRETRYGARADSLSASFVQSERTNIRTQKGRNPHIAR